MLLDTKKMKKRIYVVVFEHKLKMDFSNWSKEFIYENIRVVRLSPENNTIAFLNVDDNSNYVIIENCCKLELYTNPPCILAHIIDKKQKKITIQRYLLLETQNEDSEYKIDKLSGQMTVDEYDIVKYSVPPIVTGNKDNKCYISYVVSASKS